MSERSIGTSRKKYVLGYYIRLLHCNKIYGRSNPDVRFLSGLWTGLPAGRGFLSGRGVRGSVRNWPNFIRTVLKACAKILANSYPDFPQGPQGIIGGPVLTDLSDVSPLVSVYAET